MFAPPSRRCRPESPDGPAPATWRREGQLPDNITLPMSPPTTSAMTTAAAIAAAIIVVVSIVIRRIRSLHRS
ncbi:hypothetical protein ACFFRL_06265 [Agromyces hippuratus]|uniref:hypothetical protein n=1 Tax=Agromyces hippuratus TaxID=286438 RepID=UPI0035ED164D